MSGISSKFSSELAANPSLKVATVSAGCFWGVEHIYRKHFFDKAVVGTVVGYTGGQKSFPTYKEVCTSSTQHAEALQLLYDPEKVSYESLIDFFFRMHDPTTANRQGPDVGTQYRSAIFTHDAAQDLQSREVKERFQREFWKDQIQTAIEPIQKWWDAEEYHQNYEELHPDGYQCPTHFLRTKPQL